MHTYPKSVLYFSWLAAFYLDVTIPWFIIIRNPLLPPSIIIILYPTLIVAVPEWLSTESPFYLGLDHFRNGDSRLTNMWRHNYSYTLTC